MNLYERSQGGPPYLDSVSKHGRVERWAGKQNA